MSRGQIARWMLEETGAPYETLYLRYGPEMSAPEVGASLVAAIRKAARRMRKAMRETAEGGHVAP